MDPREKPDKPLPAEDRPGLAQMDWDALETGSSSGSRAGPDGALPGEDDDNPFQESDEALPDEAEERALRRNPSREGSRFDEA